MYYNREKLPKAVYYQCVWTVKDMKRLEEVSRRWKQWGEGREKEINIFSDNDGADYPEDVVVNAIYKLSCINDALDSIPEEYRSDILDNIIHLDKFGDQAHTNTWKKWKHRFIRRLAENLSLC